MLQNEDRIKKLKKTYKVLFQEIETAIKKFTNIWELGTDDDIFSELAFCIFTPQSKAKNCWKTVNTLKEKKLLYSGSAKNMSEFMNFVRFRNNKAKYLVLAREIFLKNSVLNIRQKISDLLITGEERDWLVKNIKGFGYKESGHFLRNIGANLDYAILDRHILKNLKALGVIEDIPKTITTKTYLIIEKKMQKFAKEISIPISHLDLLFWYNEAGEIFK